MHECPAEGPVLLTGGEMKRDDAGHEWYMLSFQWDGEGYLYFSYQYYQRTGSVKINGQETQLQPLSRGQVYPLDPTTGTTYELAIGSGKNSLLPVKTYVYLGTMEQINDYIRSSSEFSVYIRGVCFAITLFS